MFRSVRNVARVVKIAYTLARYDALFPLEQLPVAPFALWVGRRFRKRNIDGRPGERLAQALQRMGPTFIKLGQMLSTRPDLLGEQVTTDLSGLNPGTRYIRATIERSLYYFAQYADERLSDPAYPEVSPGRWHVTHREDGSGDLVLVGPEESQAV